MPAKIKDRRSSDFVKVKTNKQIYIINYWFLNLYTCINYYM